MHASRFVKVSSPKLDREQSIDDFGGCTVSGKGYVDSISPIQYLPTPVISMMGPEISVSASKNFIFSNFICFNQCYKYNYLPL